MTPADIPVTTPLLETTAKDGDVLTHVPVPDEVSVSLSPVHSVPEPTPDNGAGLGLILTAIVANAPQGLGTLYVIVVVPADTPVTRPEEGSTVATAGLLLIQLPVAPAVVLAKVAEEPIHTGGVPVIVPDALQSTVMLT